MAADGLNIWIQRMSKVVGVYFSIAALEWPLEYINYQSEVYIYYPVLASRIP